MSSSRAMSIRIFLALCMICYSGIAKGQWELVDSLLSTRIDTTDYLPYYYSDALNYNLLVASSKGYTKEILRLVAKGADINAEIDGATPLVYAVTNNHFVSVRTILSLGPVVDVITNQGETPLLIAVKNRFDDVAESLIRAGADVNYHDRRGATPLHYTSLYGYLETTDMLIYYDALPDTKASDGSTPLFGAVASGHIEVADLLLQNGANPNEKDTEGTAPLHIAAFFGDTLMMGLLYKHGADIYAVNNNGQNPLTVAIQMGYYGVVDYLLRLGNKWADKSARAAEPYDVAAKYGRKSIISLLRENNLPGSPSYKIDQVSFTLSSRFFFNDYYTGFSMALSEPYTRLGFIAGCDTKLWYTRVLMKKEENVYYQYMDRGSLAYAGVFKDILLKEKAGIASTYFSASLLAGYSFGNTLKGTLIVPGNKFKLVPEASFKFTMQYVTLIAGASYIKTDFYHNGPVWLRLGISYNYSFDNNRKKIRPIRWYSK